MSHSIHVWDPLLHGPVPQSLEEAMAMYVQLSKAASEGAKDGVNSTFLAFAQRVQDCVKFVPEPDETLMHLYGNFVEQARKVDEPLFSIELPLDDWIDIMKVMVKTANAFGLVIYDDNMGMVFLPTGQIFPAEKAEMWRGAVQYRPTPSEFPSSLTEFKKLFQREMTDFFGKHGFVKIKDKDLPSLERKIPGGRQIISLICKGGGGIFSASLSFDVDFEVVSQIHAMFPFAINMQAVCGGYTEELFDGGMKGPFRIENELHLMNFKKKVDEVLIPFLGKAVDVRGVDSVANGADFPRWKAKMYSLSPYLPYLLIVAKLAGNPDFEKIAEELAKRKRHFKTEEGYEPFMKYLREELKPIV